MDYATTPQTSKLTGLSIQKLREWTNRRAIIPADVAPRCKGSSARYTWQTILILRLAVILRDHFHLELQAHANLFENIKTRLQQTPLSLLWGKTLAVYGKDSWDLIDTAEPQKLADDMILVGLHTHLKALAASSLFPDTFNLPVQIELFPLQSTLANDGPSQRKPESGAASTGLRALA